MVAIAAADAWTSPSYVISQSHMAADRAMPSFADCDQSLESSPTFDVCQLPRHQETRLVVPVNSGVKNLSQQLLVHPEPFFVFDEPESLKLLHEEIDSRSSRPDDIRQRLLGN